MGDLPQYVRVTVEQGMARLPGPAGQRFVELFRRGGLQVELYAPKERDLQEPHARDEVYVVHRGEGWFVQGDGRDRFGPGDLLFAAAGAPHRFEGFTDDLILWVIFCGPAGGER